MDAWVAQYPGSQRRIQRVFGGVKPAHEEQMRGRLGNENSIECLNQLGQTFVARQAADKTNHCYLARNTDLVAHVAGAGREALHIHADAASLIDTLHSSCTGKSGRRIGYACSRWLPDHVTAVSRATAVSHLAARMVRQEQLSILANGIEVEAWEPNVNARREARRLLGLTDEFLWLAAGRLEAVKD